MNRINMEVLRQALSPDQVDRLNYYFLNLNPVGNQTVVIDGLIGIRAERDSYYLPGHPLCLQLFIAAPKHIPIIRAGLLGRESNSPGYVSLS